jgi:hypothetical protein
MAENKAEQIMGDDFGEDKPYVVSFWGSRPDAGNDDCWTAFDFATLEEALAFFNAPVFPKHCPASDVAWIEIDGEYINRARKNPDFRPDSTDRNNREWQNETRQQAAMAFGVEGWNDYV